MAQGERREVRNDFKALNLKKKKKKYAMWIWPELTVP